MKSKVIVWALAVAICFIPNAGCRIKKTSSNRKQSFSHLKKDVDSTAIHRFDSVGQLAQVNTESLEELMRKHQAAINEQNERTRYTRETVNKPVTIPGETYEFTGNWQLDPNSSGKEITYFDADQPGIAITISKDTANKMKVLVKTKDKVIHMQADKVAFESEKAIKSDSSQYQEQIKAAMKKDSLNQAAQVHEVDSGTVKDKTETKSRTLEQASSTKSTDYWPLVKGILYTLAAILICIFIYLAIRFGWIKSVWVRVVSKFKTPKIK